MRGACVKCGGNSVSGPHYNRAHNTLKYVCRICGYDWERPTCDQEPADPTPETHAQQLSDAQLQALADDPSIVLGRLCLAAQMAKELLRWRAEYPPVKRGGFGQGSGM